MNDWRTASTDGAEMPTAREALIGAGIGALILFGGLYVPTGWLRWLVVSIGVIWVVVMLAYVAAVTGPSLRANLVPRVRKLRGHVRADPLLGPLHRDVRARAWTASPLPGNPEFEVDVDGDSEPDSRLVTRAREAVAEFDAIQQRVNGFLASEAADESLDDEMRSQILALRVIRFVFLAADHPRTFRIEFKGPDEDVHWQCDCTDGVLRHLDFDS